MAQRRVETDSVGALDADTAALVRLAAAIAVGSEGLMRDAMASAVSDALEPEWVEELILQSYLFVGFPRALNAMRAWRQASGRQAPETDEGTAVDRAGFWAERGAATCAIVYGDMYERLRANISALHPALDTWMVVEGYGKVLARPGLDLKRRELCILAVCAVTDQERQLHSHMHGALNAGASEREVGAALAVVAEFAEADRMRRADLLWARVRNR